MGPITLWVSAAVIPVGVWVLSAAIRLRAKRELTSGADWVLLLIVFDLTAALSLNEFRQFVTYEPFRSEFPAVLMVLGIAGVVAWVTIVLYLEPWLETARRTVSDAPSKTSPLATHSMKALILVLMLSATFLTTAGHVLAFTWKGWPSTGVV